VPFVSLSFDAPLGSDYNEKPRANRGSGDIQGVHRLKENLGKFFEHSDCSAFLTRSTEVEQIAECQASLYKPDKTSVLRKP
jgi:hypothetical protein